MTAKEIRETPMGAVVYDRWAHVIRPGPRCKEWGDFVQFYNWILQAGFDSLECSVRRIDTGKPWGPENVYIFRQSAESFLRRPEAAEAAASWDRTVSKFLAALASASPEAIRKTIRLFGG